MASENKNVIRTAVGLSKAKKKQFKQRERERLAALENYNSSNIESAKQKSAVSILIFTQRLCFYNLIVKVGDILYIKFLKNSIFCLL